MNAEKLELYVRLSASTRDTGANRYSKPLHGGVWGSGRYKLGAILSFDNDFPSLTYLVFHAQSLIAVGMGDRKEEALEQGRRLVSKSDAEIIEASPAVIRHFEQLEAERLDAIRAHYAAQRSERAKVIPKRRQEIFAKSEGKCHYCGTALTLDGRWHIEHKMPRALMGGNDPSNLVASCAPCNHKKRDKTDVEFMAERARSNA